MSGFHKLGHNYASDIFMVEPTLVPNADGIDDRTSPVSTRSEEHTDRLQGPNASIGGPHQIETCCFFIIITKSVQTN